MKKLFFSLALLALTGSQVTKAGLFDPNLVWKSTQRYGCPCDRATGARWGIFKKVTIGGQTIDEFVRCATQEDLEFFIPTPAQLETIRWHCDWGVGPVVKPQMLMGDEDDDDDMMHIPEKELRLPESMRGFRGIGPVKPQMLSDEDEDENDDDMMRIPEKELRGFQGIGPVIPEHEKDED